MAKFYDTCSLLLKSSELFEENKKFFISSITLKELERIKEDRFKDPEVKYAARIFLYNLNLPENQNKCEIIIFNNNMLEPIEKADLEINDDMKILATAVFAKTSSICGEDMEFYTDDNQLFAIAKLFFDVNQIKRIGDNFDTYTGFKEVQMSDDEMANYYSHPSENLYNLHINEYIIVKDKNGNIVDTACWIGDGYRHLTYQNFNSTQFGVVKPIKDDIYQTLLADCLSHNQITMVKGKAGAGKSYMSMAYLFSQLEKGKIDRIIVFCNTVAAKNAAKLGYYPGSKDEKLLDSQIGNMLISKIGGRLAVEQMIDQDQLLLIPLSDIRGYDTTGMHAGIYITEAQNLDVNLMKTALQRIGEDSICIIDGDEKAQVDDVSFAGANNGMRRASKIFRGTEVYGEIELQQIHRSRIAEIADKM